MLFSIKLTLHSIEVQLLMILQVTLAQAEKKKVLKNEASTNGANDVPSDNEAIQVSPNRTKFAQVLEIPTSSIKGKPSHTPM